MRAVCCIVWKEIFLSLDCSFLELAAMKKAKRTYYSGEVDWRHYRFAKKHTIILSIIAIPFCLFCGYLVPTLSGNTTTAYTLFFIFLLYWTFVFQSYMTHACPQCGAIYNGCQMYSKTCRKCGVVINPKPENPKRENKETAEK
jgi:hypothetical protein